MLASGSMLACYMQEAVSFMVWHQPDRETKAFLAGALQRRRPAGPSPSFVRRGAVEMVWQDLGRLALDLVRFARALKVRPPRRRVVVGARDLVAWDVRCTSHVTSCKSKQMRTFARSAKI